MGIRVWFTVLASTLLVAVVLPFFGVHIVAAAGADTISFQGKLTNPDGTNVSDGTYSVRFRVYTDGTLDAANPCSPGTNSCEWEETQSVTVSAGIFYVQLGSVTPFGNSVDFSNPNLYLGVKVASDAEMSPRIQFTSSPYALNAQKLGGLSAQDFVQLGQGLQVDSTTGTASIHVNKTGASGDILNLQSNGAGVFILNNNGSANFYNNSGSLALLSTDAANNTVNLANGTMTVKTDGTITQNIAATKALTTNLASGAQAQFLATGAQNTDLVTISNTGNEPVASDANGAHITYGGGNAAVEGAGLKIDYTPGGTSGGTWSGVRIVANASGASTGVDSYGLKLEGPTTPAGGNNTAVKIGTGWDIGLDIQSGGMQLTNLANEPASPASNNLLVYSKDVAGRMLLKMKGPSGVDTPLQPALFFNSISFLSPSNGTAVSTYGMPNATVGTASTPTKTSTNMHTSMRRVSVKSATTANSASELRSAQTLVWRGNSGNLGGFFYSASFSVNSTISTQRLFVGLTGATGATSTSQNPSNLTNMVGVGWDSTDSNLMIMGNNNTGTAIKFDPGPNFPKNDTTAVYEIVMFAPPSGSSIGWRLTRLDTGDQASGSITATNAMPLNTTFLTHHAYMNNGGSTGSVVLDVMRIYVESDY